jgi:hypothetical protein
LASPQLRPRSHLLRVQLLGQFVSDTLHPHDCCTARAKGMLAGARGLTQESAFRRDLAVRTSQPPLVRCAISYIPSSILGSTIASDHLDSEEANRGSALDDQWYSLSKLAKRIAILGTIPLITAPRPLYNPSGVSRAAICRPVAQKPSGFSCSAWRQFPCSFPARTGSASEEG